MKKIIIPIVLIIIISGAVYISQAKNKSEVIIYPPVTLTTNEVLTTPPIEPKPTVNPTPTPAKGTVAGAYKYRAFLWSL